MGVIFKKITTIPANNPPCRGLVAATCGKCGQQYAIELTVRYADRPSDGEKDPHWPNFDPNCNERPMLCGIPASEVKK